MITSKLTSKVRAACTASVIAASVSLSATGAFSAPETETKELAPSLAASKAAEAKKIQANDKNIKAKEIKLLAPKGASSGNNALPINPGGPGPVPPKDELKPVVKPKTPSALAVDGKLIQKAKPAESIKTDIDKSAPSAPAKQ